MMADPHWKLRDPESSLLTVVFRNPLINSLALDANLLAHLVKSGLISQDQHLRLCKIQTQDGIQSSVCLLLTMIKDVQRPDVVPLFIDALKKSEDETNVLLADLIEGDNNIQDCEVEHQLIKEFYPELQDIDPTEMVPYLTYINLDEGQSLMRKCEMGESNLARTTLLLLTIRTREPGWFEVFLYALAQTGHGNVAGKLQSGRQTAQASRIEDRESDPYSVLSQSLESLNLLDNDHMEDEAIQGQPTEFSSMGASGGSLQGEFKEPTPSGLRRTVSFTEPLTSPPGTKQRSRSTSTKRSCLKQSRKYSQSPKRKRTDEQGSKRKRSTSRDQPQQVAVLNQTLVINNITNNTVDIKDSTNVKAVLGGDHNTINFSPENGPASKKPTMAHPQWREYGGEDQPDHAAMPEDDIERDGMATDRQPHRRKRTRGVDQPDHAAMPNGDDIKPSSKAAGVRIAYPERMATDRQPHQRKRTRGVDQPDHAAMPNGDDIKPSSKAAGVRIAYPEKKKTYAGQRPRLYEDQLELAEDAIKGKNTVLVAPTGSGKTHVAAYIIHDHFISQRSKLVHERCALFLVTTVNLVDQQKNKLRELLLPVDFFSVIGLFGASELSLQKEITSRNVIVLTAQLLENALEYIPLDRFSLLVFDECHLCQKDHAYNAIMARYLEEKQGGNPNLPQIIGMTASLGTGKARDQHQANQHTIQICANMDAQSISMVTKHKKALEERVNIPLEVEPIEVNCRQVDPFADKVKEMISKVELLLLESPSHAIQRLVNNEKIPTEKGSQAYRQWCDRMKRNAQKIITQDTDYRILQACIEHLMGYNSALLINKQARSKDAYDYIDKMIDTMKDRIGRFVDNDFKLLKIFANEQRDLERIKDDPDNENPLLEKLCQIILEEYQIRPQSRAILFVKTIDTTQALQDWIQETPELAFLNPGRIAGSRDMNSNQQNKVIEDFRNGTHHMLVATNLLEQGTDVPACNLVIRLDYVPSDFGHVQIKGRTRAKDGRSYLISLIDSNAADRDEANRQREVMMTQAALNLKDQSESEFLERMKSQQERDQYNRETKQQQKREIIESNADECFSFRCGMCGKHAFLSHQIGVFRGSLYVVLDPDFAQHMRMKPHPKPKKLGQDSTIIGKIFCEKCEHDWGSLARVQNSYYPSIKISLFSLVNVITAEAHTYRKWKNAPFEVKKLTQLPADTAVKVPRDLLRKLLKNL